MSKVILTSEQAKKLLPAGDRIHTFRSPAGNVLIGADWDRSDLESEIDKCKCELAGKQAMAMKHGLAIHTALGPLFVNTIEIPPFYGEPNGEENKSNSQSSGDVRV